LSRLRVALDARRLQDRPLRGVGRMLDNVVGLLASEMDLVLLTDARRPAVPCELQQRPLRPPPNAPGSFWLQWNVSRWLRDFHGVFHGTFNAIPWRTPVPSVVTIHDLSFEVHPEDFGIAKRWAFRQQARHSVKTAGRTVVDCEHARREIIGHYGLAPERVVVAPLSISPAFHPGRARFAAAVLERLGVSGRYLVALGGARRRGLEVAVAAWRRLRSSGSDIDLVVVGTDRLAPEPGLTAAGILSDEEWSAVFAGAAAFCYPTRFEGFGLPALEALASGTPVVCAPVGPLPEVLGDAAEWCEAPTEDAIFEGLRRVLGDPDHAAALRQRGLTRAQERGGWEECATQLTLAYQQAAAG
jgi:glycosyltransferase involved in cell wall biosynthesis